MKVTPHSASSLRCRLVTGCEAPVAGLQEFSKLSNLQHDVCLCSCRLNPLRPQATSSTTAPLLISLFALMHPTIYVALAVPVPQAA